MIIRLNFESFSISAELNDSPISKKLYDQLPLFIELTTWGDEAYGPIGIDLGKNDPIPEIPPGGIAYTNNGNYLCFFYGQRPAWEVDFLGMMDKNWKRLLSEPPSSVTVCKG